MCERERERVREREREREREGERERESVWSLKDGMHRSPLLNPFSLCVEILSLCLLWGIYYFLGSDCKYITLVVPLPNLFYVNWNLFYFQFQL